ncbi:SAF domain-containing protein [Actinoalloteichus hymeniacidonis]|uniref:Homoserine dehydrogenase n=1 Tax=Actinoalloteichus hymeniacidonis TaxID=340345 RepID=A0AAC9HQI4_9PSEU|nr:SAF domain-containing protein [Actinoalloteichus hymeniacidonis]AOS63473.1 putative homoserine dehydrogenase [Actinoalloteichus hymeniacidonis]MBB5908484.1 putative homoserine dehydrogenase-like protein [Actinoalloteichus hymeniacidonis]
MNHELLFAAAGDKTVTFALTGAKGGFARTLLAQSRVMPGLAPAVLCDLDVPGLHELCRELGFAESELVVATTPAEAAAAVERGAVALVADIALLTAAPYDILVEATGNPAVGHTAARDALTGGKHVAMVSKEVDSVAGVALAQLAERNGLVYTTADGDQPANLIGLHSWARLLGLEIVAIGKSGEYDLVFDPETGRLTQLDETIDAPGMAELLTLGTDVGATLAARAEAVAALRRSATADHCEMSVVANSTGCVPDVESLHYPVVRTAELADVYALRADGGILNGTGVVDVFSALRLPEEASFAGGVFAVVRTHDPVTWATLAQKGHVLSRDGRYACIYLPYHLMGVETPITLLSAVLHGRASGGGAPRQYAVLAGRADRDLAAGTVLTMGGHHHDVDGVQAVLLPAAQAPDDTAPLYLAAGATLARDVVAGELITLDDLTGHDEDLLGAWRDGLAVSRP